MVWSSGSPLLDCSGRCFHAESMPKYIDVRVHSRCHQMKRTVLMLHLWHFDCDDGHELSPGNGMHSSCWKYAGIGSWVDLCTGPLISGRMRGRKKRVS